MKKTMLVLAVVAMFGAGVAAEGALGMNEFYYDGSWNADPISALSGTNYTGLAHDDNNTLGSNTYYATTDNGIAEVTYDSGWSNAIVAGSGISYTAITQNTNNPWSTSLYFLATKEGGGIDEIAYDGSSWTATPIAALSGIVYTGIAHDRNNTWGTQFYYATTTSGVAEVAFFDDAWHSPIVAGSNTAYTAITQNPNNPWATSQYYLVTRADGGIDDFYYSSGWHADPITAIGTNTVYTGIAHDVDSAWGDLFHYATTSNGIAEVAFYDGAWHSAIIAGSNTSYTAIAQNPNDPWDFSPYFLAASVLGDIPEIGDIAVEYLGASGLAITWATGDGFSYMLLDKSDLVIGDWETNTAVSGTGGNVTVTTAVDQAQSFYKVTGE